MRNPFRGIRSKIVFLCILSIALSYSTLYLIRELVRAIIRVFPALIPFSLVERTLNEMTGFPLLPTLVGIVLFVFYLLLLSNGTVQYIRVMSKTVRQLSEGHFDESIPVQYQDELGELAANINLTAQRLRTSIEEERLATQAKNDLVTNVSHDLRTPLTTIIGYLRLIDEDRYMDEIRLRHYTNIAYAKSQRLGTMVNDLFEYTRMNYGQMTLDIETISLSDLLNQLVADFSVLLTNAPASVRLTLPDTQILVDADGEKLMRVFENLIQNAIKYSENGHFIDVRATTRKTNAVVDVVNYGTPISKSDLPHLFERFYRVDKSRTDGGSGLGLAIVKSIAELHHGSVTAESDERATTFTVSLPLHQGSSTPLNHEH